MYALNDGLIWFARPERDSTATAGQNPIDDPIHTFLNIY